MERRFKPELVASKDSYRPVLHNIFIDIKDDKTVAVATDGRRMVIIPVEIDSIHETGLIPVNAVKQARKVKKRKGEDAFYLSVPVTDPHLSQPSQVKFDDGNTHVTIDRPCLETEYPKYNQVIPKGDPVFTVGSNAELLLGLAKALGSDGTVTLKFSKPEEGMIGNSGPIEVTTQNSPGAFGLLMPCRT